MLARGSAPAFDELFRRHGGRVLGYCSRLAGERAAGEDIAQEVWIRVVRTASDWRPGNLLSWLLTIARNLALNHLRAQRRLDITDQQETFDDLVPQPDSVEKLLLQFENRQLVLKAIDDLSDQKRSALLMWLNEDLSYEQIASELGTSVNNAKSLIFRAKQELESQLRNKGKT